MGYISIADRRTLVSIRWHRRNWLQTITEVCFHLIADDWKTFCDQQSTIVCDDMETSCKWSSMYRQSDAEVKIASWYMHTFITEISVIPSQLLRSRAWGISGNEKVLYPIWFSGNRKDVFNLSDSPINYRCLPIPVERFKRVLLVSWLPNLNADK